MLGHYNKFSVQHDVPTLHILHETIIIETLRRFKFIANWTKFPRDQYSIRCVKKTICVFWVATCNIEGINHINWNIVWKHPFIFIHILRDQYAFKHKKSLFLAVGYDIEGLNHINLCILLKHYFNLPEFNNIWLFCKLKFIASG